MMLRPNFMEMLWLQVEYIFFDYMYLSPKDMMLHPNFVEILWLQVE